MAGSSLWCDGMALFDTLASEYQYPGLFFDF